MDKKKLSFAELLKKEWIPNEDDGDLHIKIKDKDSIVDHSTIALLTFMWGDYRPISHSMDKKEFFKLFKLLLKSKEMYKIIEKLDTKESKSLIAEINSEAEIEFEEED